MSGTLTIKDANKPDPTFLSDQKKYHKKPLGLPLADRISVREDELAGKRLSRKELENLFDSYYGKETPKPVERKIGSDHASHAGNRLVRNISLAASAALFMGFSLGLYSLANQGAETSLGKQFNQFIADISPFEKSAAVGVKGGKLPADKSNPFPAGKPIKTASLVVSDVSGTIKAGIPLKLSLNGDAPSTTVEIKVMNVPADAVLTAGKRDQLGVWTLKPSDLANVALVLSSTLQGPLKLDVELLEAKTGQLLTPTRRINIAIAQLPPIKLSQVLPDFR